VSQLAAPATVFFVIERATGGEPGQCIARYMNRRRLNAFTSVAVSRNHSPFARVSANR
jgi:hypothetical protein